MSDREIWDICEFCEGTGERDWLEGSVCTHCDGKGLVKISAEIEDDDYLYEDDLP